MVGCILNHEKLQHFGSTHELEFRTSFWMGKKGNLVVGSSGKL